MHLGLCEIIKSKERKTEKLNGETRENPTSRVDQVTVFVLKYTMTKFLFLIVNCDLGNVNYFFFLARTKIEKISFNYVQKNYKVRV